MQIFFSSSVHLCKQESLSYIFFSTIKEKNKLFILGDLDN